MQENSRNIYQTARECKGLTQEKSAELLNISVESLRSYEGDKRFPPNDVVEIMCDIYGTQFLAYQHLKKTAKGLAKVLPQAEKKELPVAVLNLIKELTEAVSLRDKLIEISIDGKITDDEIETFNRILKEFGELKNAIATLEFVEG